MTRKIERLQERLAGQYDELLTIARDPDAMAQHARDVSAWSVAQQLEHVALADGSILDAVDRILRGEHDDEAGEKPSKIGRVVLASGWIPRGKGKAPDVAQPKDVDGDAIIEALSRARDRCAAYDPAALSSAVGTFPHFAFGSLTAYRWLRFVRIHHDHHAKIIRDIQS